jgi:hypothetical protein
MLFPYASLQNKFRIASLPPFVLPVLTSAGSDFSPLPYLRLRIENINLTKSAEYGYIAPISALRTEFLGESLKIYPPFSATG